jgi:hypothetical protein
MPISPFVTSLYHHISNQQTPSDHLCPGVEPFGLYQVHFSQWRNHDGLFERLPGMK